MCDALYRAAITRTRTSWTQWRNLYTRTDRRERKGLRSNTTAIIYACRKARGRSNTRAVAVERERKAVGIITQASIGQVRPYRMRSSSGVSEKQRSHEDSGCDEPSGVEVASHGNGIF